MYLKRLELHGFKSFAHKTILDFEPGLTAIVGPNGSGKSNIADAIRWVTGEQSLKLLRGKKSEDVIFAGSDKKTRLSMAEVALTFDNKDRKLPFEYSEVEIRRRLFRDGESEYLVNNQKSRLFDIVEALLKSGFGASNYAVIGQGTIDQLILAGPAEIKGLVEEAAGVKPYYMKRDKTLRRLEQTRENLSQVSALISEIEPRLRSLKRQAKRMEEREAVASELASLNLEFFGSKLFELENELLSIGKGLSIKKREVAEITQAIEQFQKNLEIEERQSRESGAYLYELSNQIDGLEARKYKLQEDLAEIRGKIKADLVPGNIDQKSLNAEKLDLERQVDVLSAKLKKLTVEYKKDEESLNSLREQANSRSRPDFEKFASEFNQILDSLQVDNLDLVKNRLRQLVSNFVSRTNSFPAPAEAREQLHRLELRMVEGKVLKQAYSEQLESANAKLNQIKSLLKSNPEEFKNELFKREQELNNNLTQLNRQVEDLRASLAKVKLEDRNKRSFLAEEEKKFREKTVALAKLKEEQNQILIQETRFSTLKDGLMKEASEALGQKAAELANCKKLQTDPELTSKIEKLKHQLELAGGIDETTLNEYRETAERFEYLTSQASDLEKGVADLTAIISDLDEIIKKQFDQAFDKISGKFSEFFRILFNGGRATMSLLREEVVRTEAEQEILEEETSSQEASKSSKEIIGIEIRATPPGKKLATIAALSGGERALTAIALLCSMLASYPSPFVVLDEVDAALDEANSIRFAKILGTLVNQTQFITITHNRETMRQGHTLYGVTMGEDGISKILSVKLEKAEEIAE
ncbi:MAG: AAA family ATPase [Candidatus Doudnabacteria bacterium]|nr:AAA family ATPase [Candidatus Doudnabacteria bacterium]